MDDGVSETFAPACAQDLDSVGTQFRVRRIGDAVCQDFSVVKVLYGIQIHRFLKPREIRDILKHPFPGRKGEEVLLDQVRREAGLQFPSSCINLIRPLPAPYSR